MSNPLRRNRRSAPRHPAILPPQSAPSPIFEPLEARRLLASLPFHLDFTAPAGGVLDRHGLGTGFESVQSNSRGDHYQPALIHLLPDQGLLKLNTRGNSSAGGHSGSDNSLLNALQVSFDATGHDLIDIRIRLTGGMGVFAYGDEQAGLSFGPDQDNFIKLVAVGHPTEGSRLQFSDEYSAPAGGTWSTVPAGRVHVADWADVNALDLRLLADPRTGVVQAFYKLDGAADWTALPHAITIPAGKRAAFLSAESHAGLVAYNRNDVRDITVTADAFSVGRLAGDPQRAPGTGPSVLAMRPAPGATGVHRDAFVAVDLLLPNGGIDPATVGNATVYLLDAATSQPVAAAVNTTGGGDAITLTPSGLLAPNTSYTFHITDGVQDVAGNPFQAFAGTFTTGQSLAESDPRIAFDRAIQSASVGIGWTGLAVGPDGRLYAVTASGEIHRFDISGNGTLTNRTLLFSYESATGAKRLITGLVFDTAQPTLTAYVSHGQYIDPGNDQDRTAADWTGAITRFTGPALATRQDVITNLPRSVYDHLNNQPVFGPDGRLYFVMASNSAMGAPDTTWGNRPERLLSGALLAADVRSITSTLNVRTAEGGGTYDPYAPGAKLTIYATGVRNGWDMVWTSGGHLFIPANGSAAGGNTPAGPGNNPPAINGVNQGQHDFLFRIVPGGYYGHPNPLRGQYVLNGGNPTAGPDPAEVAQYPVGTQPGANWQGYAYDFGPNVSPNGIIEYNSNGAHFGGALDGRLLVVRYSGGDDIVILDVNAGGSVTKAYTGSFGTTGLTDPLDLVQDPATGNIYVVEAGFRSNGGNPNGLRISLLRPIPTGTAAGVSAPRMLDYGAGPSLHFNDVRGDAAPGLHHRITITNTGSSPLALPADAFVITGPGAGRFSITNAPALPTSVPVGSSITLDVNFTASAKGIVAAELTIKTSDTAQPTRTIALRGIGTTGEGGSDEPSLQRILDLYQLPINVGDPDPETTDYPSQINVPGSDEVVLQKLRKAGSGPVTIQLLASMGTAQSNAFTHTSALSFYNLNTQAKTELLRIPKTHAQTVNVSPTGTFSFDPAAEFGLVGTFYDFGPRDVWSEDGRNTWESDPNKRRKLRFFPLKDAAGAVVPNAFVFAFEEWNVATDQNDIVGIIYNVRTTADVATAALTNLSELPFDDRLIFHRIRDIDLQFPNAVHDTGSLRISNNGGQPLTISSITLGTSDFQILSGGTGGGAITVPPGGSHTVTIKFVYNDPTGLRIKLRPDVLSIQSNAADAPVQTVDLIGMWQSHSEDGRNTVGGQQGISQEPNLYDIVEALGYAIDVGPQTNGSDHNTGTNTGGRVERVGSETLSSYWLRADPAKPVEIVQLAAWHTQGELTNARTRWYPQGNTSAVTLLFQHAAAWGQTFLPPIAGGSTLARGTFNPGNAPFGIRIDGTWSDPALNKPNVANDDGHGIRWFALHDDQGRRITDAWLVAHDYVGTSFANYDYQDNIYLALNVKPVTGPSAPTGATATGSGNGILLSWTRNKEGNLAGYDILRSSTANGTFTRINTGLVTGNSFNDAGAPVGQASFYRIVPVDDNGTSGAFATASATRPTGPTVPNAPTGLNATSVTHAAVSLAWSDNSSDEQGFGVQRSLNNGAWTQIATVGAGVTAWTDAAVLPLSSYRYRVVAFNAAGESAASNTVQVSTPQAPGNLAAPQNLRASAVAHDRVALAWDDASDNETGFRLERRHPGGGWSLLASLPANATAHLDEAVSPATSYEYRVLAFNSQGQSPASNVLGVTTLPSQVNAPANVRLAGRPASTRLSIAWDDASDNETGFRIERATGTGAFAVLATLPADRTAFTDASVIPWTSYRYRIVALGAGGATAPAEPLAVTTEPAASLARPELSGSAAGERVVTLRWTDDSEGEAGFLVQRRSSGGGWADWATLPPEATAWIDRSAWGGQTLEYRVRPVAGQRAEGGGQRAEGGWSNVVSVTTPVQIQWQATQIGTAGSISTVRAGAHYDLTSGGRDVWGTSDELVFLHRRVAGDFDVAVRVIGLGGEDEGRQAGLMVRSSLAAGSANVFLKLRPADLRLTVRASSGAQTTAVAGADRPAAQSPWLRLRRVGETIIAYAGSDGQRWTEIGRVTVALGGEVHIGLAASARSETGVVNARFRDLTDLRATADLVATPTGVTATPGAGAVMLSWSDPTAGRHGFYLQRRALGGAWSALGLAEAGQTSYADTGTTPGTIYEYRVAVETPAGAGPFTPAVRATA